MTVVVLAAGTFALAGCVTEVSQATTRDASEELTASATVLQRSADEGAMLCFGGIAESLPPQCSGPVLRGWEWSTVSDEETAVGVTWGRYDVVGTWDGTTFALTRPPVGGNITDCGGITTTTGRQAGRSGDRDARPGGVQRHVADQR